MGNNIQPKVCKSLIVAFVVFILGVLWAGYSYAEGEGGEEAGSGYTSLAIAVYQDDTLKKTFTMTELESIKDSASYSYSAFNSVPSYRKADNVKGVLIQKILHESGLVLGEDQTIEFIANDGEIVKFLGYQIFAERFFFPNAKNEAGRKGQAPLSSSSEGRIPVPAMISLEDIGADEHGRLLIGQTTPAEQNYSAFLRYLVRGNKTISNDLLNGNYETRMAALVNQEFNIGQIIVHTDSPEKWNALATANPSNGSILKHGTEISFDRSVNKEPKSFGDRYCIYFTTDGTEPTVNSALYNYNNYNFGEKNEKFNRPVISKEGSVTIRTKVIGYGMKDSDVSSFVFIGYKVPAAPKIKKIKAKKKALTLKWTKVKDAKGYKIYRATKKKGKYKLVKTIGKNSTLTWTNKKLKKKKTYYYKIRAYKNVKGKVIYSNYSAVKYKKTK